jgi:1-acyl-sn-glycerol-3-phosphate acyltransferase
MGKIFYRIAHWLIKHVFLKVKIRGTHNIAANEPLILVSNHVGAFGPVSVMSSIPFKVHPWVTHEITDVTKCGYYLKNDFVAPELRLNGSLGRSLSWLLARACISVMRTVEAIPVYKRSRRIRKTMQKTLRFLEGGGSILIFPENPDHRISGGLCKFDTGFVSLAKYFYRKTRRVISFLPIAVNEKAKSIRVGKPIPFNSQVSFRKEKRRLVSELENTISSMYYEMQDQKGILPANRGANPSDCRGRIGA